MFNHFNYNHNDLQYQGCPWPSWSCRQAAQVQRQGTFQTSRFKFMQKVWCFNFNSLDVHHCRHNWRIPIHDSKVQLTVRRGSLSKNSIRPHISIEFLCTNMKTRWSRPWPWPWPLQQGMPICLHQLIFRSTSTRWTRSLPRNWRRTNSTPDAPPLWPL